MMPAKFQRALGEQYLCDNCGSPCVESRDAKSDNGICDDCQSELYRGPAIESSMNKWYSVVESCMRPAGAWAHVIFSSENRHDAELAFASSAFVGPKLGIITDRTITLVERDGRIRQTIKTRRFESTEVQFIPRY